MSVMETERTVRDPARPRPLPRPVRGHVTFESVTAGYRRPEPVIADVDLDAPPGTTIALVGRTGSGKSTLISLIPRFLDPWEGRVTLDGIDVRELSLTELRQHVALVSQDAVLLPISIADNIAYGRPHASRAEVEAAARAANATEFIDRLPDRYDTVVGERGATLSGGQRQRLAIARALLKNAPVLILDEPTSALDAETEHLILDALDRLIANRTTFVIAHRLSTVRKADLIAVVDGGRIAATGTHDELLETNALYARLDELQMRGEQAEPAPS
jgi:ATP-binding cassette subfamily B protein/subfamily B ATP-binding cassette protein MsbA